LFIGALYQQKKKSPTLKLSELDAVHRIEGQILDARKIFLSGTFCTVKKYFL
jgi:hypothetical protein